MEKTPIPNPDKSPSKITNWGLKLSGVSEWLLMSGIAAVDSQGQIVSPDDAAGQARWIYRSLQGMVERAGFSLSDVVRIETTVTEAVTADDQGEMRGALQEIFGEVPVKPVAGTRRIVKSLARPGMLVEIEWMAAR